MRVYNFLCVFLNVYEGFYFGIREREVKQLAVKWTAVYGHKPSKNSLKINLPVMEKHGMADRQDNEVN